MEQPDFFGPEGLVDGFQHQWNAVEAWVCHDVLEHSEAQLPLLQAVVAVVLSAAAPAMM